jgi:predicted transcriptional regulator
MCKFEVNSKKMGAIVIKADKESKKMLPELARKLGGSVISTDDEQFEDFALGAAMDKVKTGELSDCDEIMKKLSGK